MCSESNNANLLLLLLTDVLLGTSIVLQIQNIAQHTTLQRVAYL